jgi:hypothetical protein
MLKRLLLAAALGLILSPAVAQEKTQEQLREERGIIFHHDGIQRHDYNRIVPSGVKAKVGYWSNVNPDCSSKGEPAVRVTNPPEHGATEITKSTDYPGYAKENIRAKCNQHKVAVTQISYKSADKYVGKDTMELLVIFPDSGQAWEIHYEIDVR